MNNWKANTLIYGEGIRQTSTAGTGYATWYNDSAYFPGLSYPFSVRGGPYLSSLNAGLLCFSRNIGSSHYIIGFRTAVIVL